MSYFYFLLILYSLKLHCYNLVLQQCKPKSYQMKSVARLLYNEKKRNTKL